MATQSPETGPRTVAVVIAAWRAADSVGRAVASALAQPETAEVVVADDASGDERATLNAARAADDGTGRLKLIEMRQNGGPAAARNAAIAASTAPWIAVLDSDDYFLPGRFATLLAASAHLDFVADDITQIHHGADESAGKRIWFGASAAHTAAAIDLTLSAFICGNLPDPKRPRGELGFMKPLLRRAFLDAHGLRYSESMRLGEDYDLYARIFAAGGRGRLLPSSGYVGVLRAGSLSDTRRRSDLETFMAADDRLAALPERTDGERKLIAQHRHTVARIVAWIDFVEALKRKQVGRAAGVIWRYPASTPYILGHLRDIAVRRLSPRSA